MLLTNEMQASTPDVTQVESHINYFVQKNVELVDLDKQITDTYEKELEAAKEHGRKVSPAWFFLQELATKATVTTISRPNATLPNADTGRGFTSTTNEVSDSSLPTVTETMIHSQVNVPRHRTVVLPKLQIPTFSGALRDCQSFWNHFSATINLNAELLSIEKFKYLLTYLTGIEKRAI